MAESTDLQQQRIDATIEGIKRDYSSRVVDLFQDLNTSRLSGNGKITAAPVVEGASLRWTLEWTEERKISFELSLVVNVEDDGREARIGRVWVHRHASTPLDYDGHTPTTRMRRLTGLSLREIREAIDAEWT